MPLTIRNSLAFLMAKVLLISGSVRKAVKKALTEQIILSLYCHNPSEIFFDASIQWLQKRGFRFISVNDLAAISAGEMDFPRGAVIVTVDDGWRDNKKSIVAIANKYKIPVTIFVSTEPVSSGDAYWWSYVTRANRLGLIDQSVEALKKVNNKERLRIMEMVKSRMPLQREAFTIKELREIAQTGLVSIESHTVTHPILTKCTDQEAWFEINESKKILEGWLGTKIIGFAYPNGNFSEREIQYLNNSGYELAFTTRDNYITPDNISATYTLPRVDLIEEISFAENVCRMTGVWFKKREQLNILLKREKSLFYSWK